MGASLSLDEVILVNTSSSIAIGDETTIVDMATMDSAFGATSAGFPIMGVRRDAGGSIVSADGDSHPLVFNDASELKVAANLSSSVADDAADSGNPIKMGGKSNFGLLAALSTTGDRYDLTGDAYRRTYVNNAYNVAIEITTETVTGTAAEIVATPMAGRKAMTIQNSTNDSVWLGHDTNVTADDAATGGFEIKKNAIFHDDFGENINVWMIAGGAGRTIKVLEKG